VAPAPERDELVFLGIDEPSLSLSAIDEEAREGEVLRHFRQQWPWSRAVWAAAIERLGSAGARMIVIDIALKNLSVSPEEQAFMEALGGLAGALEDRLPTEGDEGLRGAMQTVNQALGQLSTSQGAEAALIGAIEKHRDKVVLAAYLEEKPPDEYGGVLTTFAEPNEEYLGPLEDETMFGFVNFWHSADGNVRTTTYRLSLREANALERHPDEYVYESIAAVVGRQLGVLPPDGSQRLRFAVRGKVENGRKVRDIASVYPPLSLYRIFHEPDWESEFGGGTFFKDKIIVIGPSAPIFQDKHATPAGTVDGGQLHLQAIGCLLAGAFLHDAPPYWAWVGLFGMALVGWLLVSWLKNPVGVVVLTALAGVFWLISGIFIADQTSLLIGGVPGVLGLGGVVLFGQSFESLQARIERNRLFGQLSRSVSRDVAVAMVRSPDGYIDSARGGRRTVVVLFSDVRGFTKRSERENPETLVAQLNEYLSKLVEIIFAHGGTLDKFIGDAILATWGGLEDTRPGDMAAAAVKAAVEMCEGLEELNAKWTEEGREPFEAGIGVHIGEAVIGEVGSRQRSDFTAIGDAVNLASRIEGMTKMMQVPILVSGEIAALQPGNRGLCPLGRFRVKGRSEPVEIVAAGVEEEEAFREALARFGQGDLVKVEDVMLEISADSSLSGPAKFYLQQMEVWKKVPKSEWDGVITLESK
jgi:adenylate cyclase